MSGAEAVRVFVLKAVVGWAVIEVSSLRVEVVSTVTTVEGFGTERAVRG